jgi:hypothetical protein
MVSYRRSRRGMTIPDRRGRRIPWRGGRNKTVSTLCAKVLFNSLAGRASLHDYWGSTGLTESRMTGNLHDHHLRHLASTTTIIKQSSVHA